MTASHPFLVELQEAAQGAERAESLLRKEMAARTKGLAGERAFAYRRMNVMRSLFEMVSQAESEEIAVAAAVAALRKRLGWVDDSPARDEVLAEYAKVASAAFHDARPADDEAKVILASTGGEDERPDTRQALAAFERWYAGTREKPFWVLFEHYMPETQLVDF